MLTELQGMFFIWNIISQGMGTIRSNILTLVVLRVGILHLTGSGHTYFSTKEMANNTQG